MKIIEKNDFLQKFVESNKFFLKSLTNFCEYFEFGAVRSNVNHVDLEMLKDEYLVAKIGFDTEENEPSKV